MVPLSICSFIEISLACICASLATLRPLLQKLGLGPRSLAAAASDKGEARCDRWEGLGSEGTPRNKNEAEVFAWYSDGRDGDVGMQALESSLAKSAVSFGGYR
jgi:hypothetical protein